MNLIPSIEAPRYATHRATFAIVVIEILKREDLNHLGNQPELYLYGYQSLNRIGNRKIMSLTI